MDLEFIAQKIEEMALAYEAIVKSIEPNSIPDDKSRIGILGVGLKILGKSLTSIEMALHAPIEEIKKANSEVEKIQAQENIAVSSLTSNVVTGNFVKDDNNV